MRRMVDSDYLVIERLTSIDALVIATRHRTGLLHAAGIAVAVDDARGLPSESRTVLLLRAQGQTGEYSSPTLAKFSFVEEFCDNAD
jgi:hypothetical protein